MQITYLGHAGFCVETAQSLVVMDPWLSPTGAFDAGWFQFPCNHHLAAFVQEKLRDDTKARYLYISHEHKDHFDPAFLRSLPGRDFHLVLARFRRPYLREALADYTCRGLVVLDHGEALDLPDGYLRLFIDDSELNRDSAIFVRAGAHTFLNLNDCKLHDQLPEIRTQEETVEVFAAQFSGATWHPTCYDYPEDQYARISKKKRISKFEATAKAIEAVQPTWYLPSAGPPCFLDPLLMHLNFEPVNIFPRAETVKAYLTKRLRKTHPVEIPDLMPGDVLDVAAGAFAFQTPERVTEATFEPYVRAYADRYAGFFRERRLEASPDERGMILSRLQDALTEKLQHFTLSERLDRPLYVRFSDADDHLVRVDFQARAVTPVSAIAEPVYYALAAPSWELKRVLDGTLTWEDFSLTFRMRLNREPDVYQTLMQGFLIMEPEDLNAFCAKVLDLEAQRERIVVEAGGCRYAVDRYCPHQGADLRQAWIEDDRYLVCPRHRWRFDLHEDGRCDTNEGSIHAIPLEED